jgi:hypothetical protein
LFSSIAANAIIPKIDIKSKLKDELNNFGVGMDDQCNFQLVDDEKFPFMGLVQCEADIYVEKLLAEIWPHHDYVEYLVGALNQQQGSEQTLEALTSALVEFSKTVLIGELQLISNFPLWAAEDKAAILYNVRESASFRRRFID